jgi:membrane associated rhomboid family serine protease
MVRFTLLTGARPGRSGKRKRPVFIPYRVDASIRRWPIANLVILALLVICYALERALLPEHMKYVALFVLAKGNPVALFGYNFLHGDILHLAGNMMFLWVFGNAVCVRVGNLAYVFIFLALGAVAGMTHLSLNGDPAIGASGAINGIVGMFLVWFPTSNISVFYTWFVRMGSFQIRSYWMILFWLIFDVLGAAFGMSGVAYWAHVGGFAAGFGLAVFLLEFGHIRLEPDEKSLLQLLGPQKNPDDELGPITPRVAVASVAGAAPVLPRSARTATKLAPPEGYFMSFPCACGAELRAPRKLAGQEFTCSRCAARTRIPEARD